MLDKNNFILVATLKEAYGLKGDLRVHIYTHDPQNLLLYKNLYTADGQIFTVEKLKINGKKAIIQLKNIQNRTQAEALFNKQLFIQRNQLEDLEEDEFYYSDLIGCKVIDQDSNHWGKVKNVLDFGAGAILEITLPSGQISLIPFNKHTVPQLDIDHKILTICPDLAGLIPSDES